MRRDVSSSNHFKLTSVASKVFEKDIDRLKDRYAANINLSMPDTPFQLYCILLSKRATPASKVLLRQEIERFSPQILIDPGEDGLTWVCALSREQSEHIRTHNGVSQVGGVSIDLERFNSIFFPKAPVNT